VEAIYPDINQDSRQELVLPVKRIQTEGSSYLSDEEPSAAEKAYWKIREKIINLDFPPGSVIRDTDLSDLLGYGRTPIREAIKRLEVESLVVSHHRKGTFVNEITLVDIRRQYQIRRQLQTLAVALASHSSEKGLIHLDRKVRKLISNARIYSLETSIEKNAELDLEFARLSGNPYLLRTTQQYCGYNRRTWHLLAGELTADDLMLTDYINITAWAIKGNEEESSRLMALHVDAVHLKTVDRFLEKFI